MAATIATERIDDLLVELCSRRPRSIAYERLAKVIEHTPASKPRDATSTMTARS